MAELTDAQKAAVKSWIAEGATLAEVQNRLASEFGLKLTFMEVRLLAVELNATVKERKPPTSPTPPPLDTRTTESASEAEAVEGEILPEENEMKGPGGGGVRVEVDRVMKPGAVVSGTVTFSDGTRGEWMLDQYGRLGLSGLKPGYRPSAADVQEFQAALQRELMRQGYA